MSIFLAVVTQPWFLATVPFAVGLLLLGIAYQPRQLFPARHRAGVRATRIVRALKKERARYRRPTGWQSPAWTVQGEAATR